MSPTGAPATVPAPPTTPAPAAPVPFVDLQRIHAPLRAGILGDIAALVDSGAFANGPAVAEFERGLRGLLRTPYAVGVASGLDALRLGLLAAGIGTGDEVIVPANTFTATLEAVLQAGADPVVVDVSDADYNVDVAAAGGASPPHACALAGAPLRADGRHAGARAAGGARTGS